MRGAPRALVGYDHDKPETRSSRLNVAQRVVMSIGWGVGLMALGMTTETWRSSAIGGWFGYVAGSSFPGAPFLVRHPGLRLLMWLALTGLWAAVSVWLFGVSAPGRDRADGDE